MVNSELALFGGKPTRLSLFPKYPVIDEQEEMAVIEVLKSKKLSTFVASPGENFLGGEKIKQFEQNFATYIGTKYAISFNSATSALHAAIVSVEVQPGEEGAMWNSHNVLRTMSSQSAQHILLLQNGGR